MEELDEALTVYAPKMRPSVYKTKAKHRRSQTVVNGGNAGMDELSMIGDEEIEDIVAHQPIKKGKHHEGTQPGQKVLLDQD